MTTGLKADWTNNDAQAHHGVPLQLTPRERRIVFLSMWAFGAVLCLDRLTSSSYQTMATNSFDKHSLLTLVSVIRAIAAAIAGPPFAQLCDMAGRDRAYLAATLLYSAGCLVMCSASGIIHFGIGGAIYEIGANGLVVTQIVVIADLTSERSRLLFQLFPQAAFVVLGFPSAKIYAAMLNKWGWRWGIGMFAALGPVALLPLLVSLVISSKRTRQRWRTRFGSPAFATGSNGDGNPLVPLHGEKRHIRLRLQTLRPACSYFLSQVTKFAVMTDLVGLALLFGTLIALLVPFTIAARSPEQWASWQVIVPLALGAAFGLPAFVVWEKHGATRAVIPSDLVASRAWLAPSLVTLLFWAAYMVQGSYLTTYLYVVNDVTETVQQYISVLYSVTDCAFGLLLVAPLVRGTRRLHPFQLTGLSTCLVAAGLMIAYRSPTDLARMAVAQVVLGVAGSLVVAPSQVTVQVSVSKQQLSSAIAALNVMNCVGTAVGSAIAGAIWSNTLRPKLADEVYSGPLTWIESHPVGTSERTGVILAYEATQKVMTIASIALFAAALVAGLFLPRPRLGASHKEQDAINPN